MLWVLAISTIGFEDARLCQASQLSPKQLIVNTNIKRLSGVVNSLAASATIAYTDIRSILYEHAYQRDTGKGSEYEERTNIHARKDWK